MPTGPEPGIKTISGSIFAGLGIRGDLTPAMIPTITFSPTLGIAAGRIDKLGMNIKSFRVPLHRSVKDVMVPSIRRNFDEGGRPTWEPLSEFTIIMRSKEGTGDKPLVRTGKLKRVASQINLWDITSTAAVIRDIPQDVWYGKVHQEGYGGLSPTAASELLKKHGGSITKTATEIKKRTSMGKKSSPDIPARPFLIIQPEDETGIRDVFIRWLGERVAATMWR